MDSSSQSARKVHAELTMRRWTSSTDAIGAVPHRRPPGLREATCTRRHRCCATSLRYVSVTVQARSPYARLDVAPFFMMYRQTTFYIRPPPTPAVRHGSQLTQISNFATSFSLFLGSSQHLFAVHKRENAPKRDVVSDTMRARNNV